MKLRLFFSLFRAIKIILFNKGSTIDFVQGWAHSSKVIFSQGGTMNLKRGIVLEHGVKLKAEKGVLNIGKSCYFNTNCAVTAEESVTIGDFCSFGNNTVIVDHDHDFRNVNNGEFISSPVEIGDNVWVGANCVILRGTKIGNNSVIAAGSVVKGDIPEGVLYYQKREYGIKEIKKL